jgi:putative holliday junction resolvase
MRKGRRLAVDVGKARIGLAISDQDGILATPFETVARLDSVTASATAIAKAVDDYTFLEAYVGLPLSLSGGHTPSTSDALALAHEISRALDIEVRLVDERLTTVSASANLRLAGRNAKNSRSVIDQEAAAIILEQALSGEKSTGNQPGRPLSDFPIESTSPIELEQNHPTEER